jgi:hypothetical protein
MAFARTVLILPKSALLERKSDVTRLRRSSWAAGVALTDDGGRETGVMMSPSASSVFAGLSCRDAGELLAEPGVTVDHVTVYRWVQRFTPEFIEAARLCRHAPGDRWFADETYVKVSGQWTYLYRAIDQHGQTASCGQVAALG